MDDLGASVIQSAMHDHFLQTCRKHGCGLILSLPAPADWQEAVVPLADFLTQPVGSVPLQRPLHTVFDHQVAADMGGTGGTS